MKILYVTTIGSTMNFFKKFIEELVAEGHTVEIACNDSISAVPDFYLDLGCKIYSIGTSRSPFKIGNIHAIKQIKDIVEQNKYDIVHCHTPIAAMCTRLACRKVRQSGTKVIYTAHGLHFYKGAPLNNWLIFFPIEWICSWWTDAIVLINEEDYQLAQNWFKARMCIRIPGVGIDLSRFVLKEFDKVKYRAKLGLKDDDLVVLSVGEVNKNKNHQLIIKTIADMNNPKIKYIIAGRGPKTKENEELAEVLGLGDSVHFLGYRSDIAELNAVADVFAFPSIREGLGLAAIEALACGTPVVGMDTRGIREYVIDGKTGYKFKNTTDSCVNAIENCFSMIEKDEEYAENCKLIAQKYRYEIMDEIMQRLYEEIGSV